MCEDDYSDAVLMWSHIDGMGLRSIDDSAEGIAKLLSYNQGLCSVATVNGVFAGTMLCGYDGRRAHLYHLAVHPDFRGMGLGRLLVQRTLEKLKERGANKATLVVFSDNDKGNSFWEHLGFKSRCDLIYRDISLNTNNI